MTGQRWKVWLLTLSISMLTVALLFCFSPAARDQGAPPADLEGRLRWLAAHPADWRVASQISDQALESPLPRRLELWRGSHELSSRLAPYRFDANAAFVRAGMFHWYELSEADRAAVLRNAEPLLQNPTHFDAMALPLWQLTGNVALLRKAAGGNVLRLKQVAGIAVTNGHFADYREISAELRGARLRDLRSARATSAPAELLQYVDPPLDTRDLPLVKELLDALHTRPIDRNPAHVHAAEALLTFALRHDLGPLDGLEYMVREPAGAADPIRARLALRLGERQRASQIHLLSGVTDPRQWTEFERELAGQHAPPARGEQWDGLCGEFLCESAARQLTAESARRVAVDVQKTESDNVPPYIEVFLDDRLVAEGEVGDSRRFEFDAPAGLHRVEVRLVNPLTRNLAHRRVRLSSLS